jgi:hypothetical protein
MNDQSHVCEVWRVLDIVTLILKLLSHEESTRLREREIDIQCVRESVCMRLRGFLLFVPINRQKLQ